MGQKPPSVVAAKRRASRISSLQTQEERTGKPLTGEERGFIRLGASTTRILVGSEDLSTWTDEELRRGQRADKNGRFQGRVPKVVPKAVHDELVKRTLYEAGEKLRTNLVAAVDVLVDVMTGADVEPKDKLKAVSMIMDRVLGKAPEKVEHHISGDTKWEKALDVLFVGEEEDVDNIIEVDFTEVDDDEDPFADKEDG